MDKVYVVVLQANEDVGFDEASAVAVCKTRAIAERWIKTTHKQIVKDDGVKIADAQKEYNYTIEECPMVNG